jgi:tyrosinase
MANGIVVRPSVGQANIPALRDAYDKMQALAPTDNRSWVYWAEYHGFNRFDCWHGGRLHGIDYPYDLFLPWHRAYLLNWDHVTRDQNEDAILPWWDWTSDTSHQVGVPESYSEDPDNNPLATGTTPDMPNDPARRTRRFPGTPARLPFYDKTNPLTPSLPLSIEEIVNLPSFTDFSNQVQNVHNFIHGWTGGRNPSDPNIDGDMGGIGTSAFDPIFWAHHGMIDRLWYLWQLNNGVNNIPTVYLDKVVEPFGFTVEQVLDVRQLGYDYATSAVSTSPEDNEPASEGGS